MDIALSQEGNNIELLIKGINWGQLSNALKDEIVSVESFKLIIDNNLAYPEDMDGVVTKEIELPKQKLSISEIKNQLVLYHTVESYHELNEARVKASFPKLLDKQGLSSTELWNTYLSFMVEHEQPFDVDLRNMNFHLKSIDDWEFPYTYRFTFWRTEKLLDFIGAIQNGMTDIELIRNSIITETPYVAEKWKVPFSEAEQIGWLERFWSLRMLPYDQEIIEFSEIPRAAGDTPPLFEPKISHHSDHIEYALNQQDYCIELYIEGLDWKKLDSAFNNEIVNVFDLQFFCQDNYILQDNNFTQDGNSVYLRNRKIMFGELTERINRLNLGTDENMLLSVQLGNKNCFLRYHYNNSFSLRFWQKDKATIFINALREFTPQDIIDNIKQAIATETSYATAEFKEDFKKVKSIDRMERFMKVLTRYKTKPIEPEFKRAVEKIAHEGTFIPGHEPNEGNINDTDKNESSYHMGDELLAYFILVRDGLERFDGEGYIYGFDGETLIRNLISFFGDRRFRQREYLEDMEDLLQQYTRRFRSSEGRPVQY